MTWIYIVLTVLLVLLALLLGYLLSSGKKNQKSQIYKINEEEKNHQETSVDISSTVINNTVQSGYYYLQWIPTGQYLNVDRTNINRTNFYDYVVLLDHPIEWKYDSLNYHISNDVYGYLSQVNPGRNGSTLVASAKDTATPLLLISSNSSSNDITGSIVKIADIKWCALPKYTNRESSQTEDEDNFLLINKNIQGSCEGATNWRFIRIE